MKALFPPLLGAALAPVLVITLGACTTTAPIPASPSKAMVREVEGDDALDKPRSQAAKTGGPTVVAVCYNGMVNTDAEVLAEAALACPEGKLTVRDDDVLWTSCPLLQPQRANFICMPANPPKTLKPAQ